jgi:hypothetical protein
VALVEIYLLFGMGKEHMNFTGTGKEYTVSTRTTRQRTEVCPEVEVECPNSHSSHGKIRL